MSMPVHVTRAAITQAPRRTDGVPVHTNPRPGRCMDSTHRFSHLTSLPSLFRSVPALSSPVMFPRRLVCPGFFSFVFPFFFVVPFPRRLVVLSCTAPLRCVRVPKGVGRHDGERQRGGGSRFPGRTSHVQAGHGE